MLLRGGENVGSNSGRVLFKIHKLDHKAETAHDIVHSRQMFHQLSYIRTEAAQLAGLNHTYVQCNVTRRKVSQPEDQANSNIIHRK